MTHASYSLCPGCSLSPSLSRAAGAPGPWFFPVTLRSLLPVPWPASLPGRELQAGWYLCFACVFVVPSTGPGTREGDGGARPGVGVRPTQRGA